MEADTGDGSDLASDVSNSKIPTTTAVESSGPEDDEHDDDELPSVQFVESVYFKRLIQLSIVVSAISVAMNSKKTLANHGRLWYVTIVLDILVLFLFLIESLMDMKILGLWKGERAFLKNRVNLFNLAMLIFILMSVVLQIIEGPSSSVYVPQYLKIIARAPRSLILIRVMKYFMNYSLLNKVLRRSGKQILNVTIFLLYFMILASLIGVQLFGEKSYYCVKNGTDPKNVSYKDLNLPEIRCRHDKAAASSTVCPQRFMCRSLKLSDNQRTTYFENVWYSFLTVYESSTQEGWVLVMYAQMNSQDYYVSAVYFVSLIFFVAWLVKSVFIAVITETFADLRSQLYLKNWRTNRRVTGLSSEIIQDDGTGWHLVAIKEEWTKTKAFNRARQFLTSKYFRYMIWTLLALDALLQATLDPSIRRKLQIVFTVIFDVESFFKIWCVGVKSYWKIPMYRFELFLAVGSTLCVGAVANWELDILALFHVLRVTRLIIAVPSLNAFLYKAFGTGTKIGAVVIFTLFFLVFASILSLQLFSGMDFDKDGPFDDYLKSSTSMFQIITQEGWVEVLDTVKYNSPSIIAPLVSIYFTSYNLFASLILGSVFVAVILDNLEIKEETKILKQRKLGEEGLNIQESLPRRLQIFAKFKESPRLVETWKVSGDYSVPKVRQSFMRKFLDDPRMRLSRFTANPSVYEDALMTQTKDLPFKLLSSPVPDDVHTLRLKKRTSLTQLIQDSTRRRNLNDHTATHSRHTAKSYLLGYTARQLNRNAAKLTQGARKTSEKADMNALRQMKSEGGRGSATLPHNTGTRNNEDWNIGELRARRDQAQRVKAAHEESLRENHPYFDFPLFLVSRDCLLRQWLQRIVHARYEISGIHGEVQSKRRMINDAFIKRVLSTQTYLEWVIILITLSSCIAMMFEKPGYRTFDVPALEFFEYLFVVSTSLELLIRVLADGLLFTPNAVIQSFGDFIDISIYLIGFIYVCSSPKFISRRSSAHALLVLRALRPLRVINLIPKTRQVIQELFGGYREILKVAALQLSLMFIFASYGVQMFSNKLKRCNDETIETKEKCHGVFFATLKGPREMRELSGSENEMLVPRVWTNPKSFNFDNILHALLALFEALSLEGWLEIRNVIDGQKQLGPLYGFYIHGYVLLACMIGLALFVGVVVNNFNENKGTALLTVDQRRWEDLRKRLRLAQPLHLPLRPDDSPVRSRLYDFLQSTHYGRVNVILVVLNCATLAVVPWIVDPGSPVSKNLMLFSVVLTTLFVIDCVLKITAYTFSGYWRSHRNRFDFILTLTGVVWITLHFAFVHDDPLKKMYRGTVWLGVGIILFRFLSLSGKHDTLKMLMMTVSMSLVKSFYIIFVLLLIIMSYAMIGVILFGTVKHGVAINRDANFEGSINAMIMLFRITTGEDWNKVMLDCSIQPPYCTEEKSEDYWKSDCGTRFGAHAYFISFYVILTFVLLNLLIAVIIENFSLFYSSEEDAALSHQDLYQYQLTWNLVDQNRKGFITVRQARLVLRLLRGRLGVDPSTFLFKHICLEIEKFRGGREVSFHDLLEILAYRSIDDISRSLQLEELLAREELERSIEEEVAIQTIRDWFLNLKKEKAIKKSRGYSFGGVSSASSVETLTSEEEEEQPNRLSVKQFQKRSVSSKTSTPAITVTSEPEPQAKAKQEEKVDEKQVEEKQLDEWFMNQAT